MSEYEKYLKSPEWEKLKKRAMERARGQCEFCGDVAYAIHHVRYPKVLTFDFDCLDNLVAVCRRCHELSHGIRRSGTGRPLKAILRDMFQDLRFGEVDSSREERSPYDFGDGFEEEVPGIPF